MYDDNVESLMVSDDDSAVDDEFVSAEPEAP